VRPATLRTRLLLAAVYLLTVVVVALEVPLAVNLSRRATREFEAALQNDAVLTAARINDDVPLVGPDPASAAAPVTVSGAALPEFNLSASPPDAAVGQTAPTLTGVNFAGEPITIGNDGKPKVIMFLAHWCPHCQAEVPRIQNWLDEHGLPSDVSLYAMPTSTNASRPNYPPSALLVGKNWTVPVLVDSEQSDAATAYGLTSFPYFVVIGADGKVVERTSGELSMTDFAKLIDSARTGHPQ